MNSVLIKEPVAQQYNILRTKNYFKNCVKNKHITPNYGPKHTYI